MLSILSILIFAGAVYLLIFAPRAVQQRILVRYHSVRLWISEFAHLHSDKETQKDFRNLEKSIEEYHKTKQPTHSKTVIGQVAAKKRDKARKLTGFRM